MTIKTERSSHDRATTNLHPKHEGNSPHLVEIFQGSEGNQSVFQKSSISNCYPLACKSALYIRSKKYQSCFFK